MTYDVTSIYKIILMYREMKNINDWIVTAAESGQAHVGQALAAIHGMTETGTLSGLGTIGSVINNDNIMVNVIENRCGMFVFANNPSLLKTSLSKNTQRNAWCNNQEFMNYAIQSESLSVYVLISFTDLNINDFDSLSSIANNYDAMYAIANNKKALQFIAKTGYMRNIFINTPISKQYIRSSNLIIQKTNPGNSQYDITEYNDLCIIIKATLTNNYTVGLQKCYIDNEETTRTCAGNPNFDSAIFATEFTVSGTGYNFSTTYQRWYIPLGEE